MTVFAICFFFWWWSQTPVSFLKGSSHYTIWSDLDLPVAYLSSPWQLVFSDASVSKMLSERISEASVSQGWCMPWDHRHQDWADAGFWQNFCLSFSSCSMRHFDRAALFIEACLKYGVMEANDSSNILFTVLWEPFITRVWLLPLSVSATDVHLKILFTTRVNLETPRSTQLIFAAAL